MSGMNESLKNLNEIAKRNKFFGVMGTSDITVGYADGILQWWLDTESGIYWFDNGFISNEGVYLYEQ